MARTRSVLKVEVEFGTDAKALQSDIANIISRVESQFKRAKLTGSIDTFAKDIQNDVLDLKALKTKVNTEIRKLKTQIRNAGEGVDPALERQLKSLLKLAGSFDNASAAIVGYRNKVEDLQEAFKRTGNEAGKTLKGLRTDVKDAAGVVTAEARRIAGALKDMSKPVDVNLNLALFNNINSAITKLERRALEARNAIANIANGTTVASAKQLRELQSNLTAAENALKSSYNRRNALEAQQVERAKREARQAAVAEARAFELRNAANRPGYTQNTQNLRKEHNARKRALRNNFASGAGGPLDLSWYDNALAVQERDIQKSARVLKSAADNPNSVSAAELRKQKRNLGVLTTRRDIVAKGRQELLDLQEEGERRLAESRLKSKGYTTQQSRRADTRDLRTRTAQGLRQIRLDRQNNIPNIPSQSSILNTQLRNDAEQKVKTLTASLQDHADGKIQLSPRALSRLKTDLAHYNALIESVVNAEEKLETARLAAQRAVSAKLDREAAKGRAEREKAARVLGADGTGVDDLQSRLRAENNAQKRNIHAGGVTAGSVFNGSNFAKIQAEAIAQAEVARKRIEAIMQGSSVNYDGELADLRAYLAKAKALADSARDHELNAEKAHAAALRRLNNRPNGPDGPKGPRPPRTNRRGVGLGSIGSGLNHLVTNVAQLGGTSLYGLGVAGGIATIAGSSVAGAMEADQTKTVLSGLINTYTTFTDVSGKATSAQDNFNRSMYKAQSLYKELRVAADKSILTTKELLTYFTGGFASGGKSGLDTKQILYVVERLGTLGKATGLRELDVAQDIRNLVARGAPIQASNKTANYLGIRTQDREKAFKEGGAEGFTKLLKEKLKGMDYALAVFENSFSAKWSTFVDKIQQVGIVFGETIIPYVIPGLDEMTKSLKAWAESGKARVFARDLGVMTGKIAEMGVAVVNFVAFTAQNPLQVLLMGAAVGIGALVAKLKLMEYVQGAAGGPIGLAIAGITALIWYIGELGKNAEEAAMRNTAGMSAVAEASDSSVAGASRRKAKASAALEAASTTSPVAFMRELEKDRAYAATNPAAPIKGDIALAKNAYEAAFSIYPSNIDKSTGVERVDFRRIYPTFESFLKELQTNPKKAADAIASISAEGRDGGFRPLKGGRGFEEQEKDIAQVKSRASEAESKFIGPFYRKIMGPESARFWSTGTEASPEVQRYREFVNKGGLAGIRLREEVEAEMAATLAKAGIDVKAEKAGTFADPVTGVTTVNTGISSAEKYARLSGKDAKFAAKIFPEIIKRKIGGIPNDPMPEDPAKAKKVNVPGFSTLAIEKDVSREMDRIEALQGRLQAIDTSLAAIDGDNTSFGINKKRKLIEAKGEVGRALAKANANLKIAQIPDMAISQGGNVLGNPESVFAGINAKAGKQLIGMLGKGLEGSVKSTEFKQQCAFFASKLLQGTGVAISTEPSVPGLVRAVLESGGKKVARGDARPGDLVVIPSKSANSGFHAGVFAGGGIMVDTMSSADPAKRGVRTNRAIGKDAEFYRPARTGETSQAFNDAVKVTGVLLQKAKNKGIKDSNKIGAIQLQAQRDIAEVALNTKKELERLDLESLEYESTKNFATTEYQLKLRSIEERRAFERAQEKGVFDPMYNQKATTLEANERMRLLEAEARKQVQVLDPVTKKIDENRTNARLYAALNNVPMPGESRSFKDLRTEIFRKKDIEAKSTASEMEAAARRDKVALEEENAKAEENLRYGREQARLRTAQARAVRFQKRQDNYSVRGLTGDDREVANLELEISSLRKLQEDLAINTDGRYDLPMIQDDIQRRIDQKKNTVAAIQRNRVYQDYGFNKAFENTQANFNGTPITQTRSQVMQDSIEGEVARFTSTSEAAQRWKLGSMGIDTSKYSAAQLPRLYQSSLYSKNAGRAKADRQADMLEKAALAGLTGENPLTGFASELGYTSKGMMSASIDKLIKGKFKGTPASGRRNATTANGERTGAWADLGSSYLIERFADTQNTFAGEGAAIGSLVGAAFPGLGVFGGAVGSLAGAVLGGIFGKGKAPDPEAEAYKKKIADLLSKIEANSRPVADYYRTKAGAWNAESAHLSGRSLGYGAALGI